MKKKTKQWLSIFLVLVYLLTGVGPGNMAPGFAGQSHTPDNTAVAESVYGTGYDGIHANPATTDHSTAVGEAVYNTPAEQDMPSEPGALYAKTLTAAATVAKSVYVTIAYAGIQNCPVTADRDITVGAAVYNILTERQIPFAADAGYSITAPLMVTASSSTKFTMGSYSTVWFS